MNLQRLRYAREIARKNLNLTAAAAALHTSQPGVSRQVLELEAELGVQIFVRKGKRIVAITEVGMRVIASASKILDEIDNLAQVAEQFEAQETGLLVIATTHTQARYVLPPLLLQFRLLYPKVNLKLRQGTPKQIARWIDEGDADVGLATEALDRQSTFEVTPWYTWTHSLIAPRESEWQLARLLTLQTLAGVPLVTYDEAFTGRAAIDRAFAGAGLSPEIALAALDSDVIKTYVRMGLGVGIVSGVAIDKKADSDFQVQDVGHLFGKHVTKLALKTTRVPKAYVNAFVALLASGKMPA
jgi:DNA-binding transcriptional LysR family regulator